MNIMEWSLRPGACTAVTMITTLCFVLLPLTATSSALPAENICRQGEYWCQDRCGSDLQGDTCCETPDGQHNLCGQGTICCMYGCCLVGSVCNSVGGCDWPQPGLTTEAATGSSSEAPANTSCPMTTPITTVEATLTVYETWLSTAYLTWTSSPACVDNSTSQVPPPSSFSSVISSLSSSSANTSDTSGPQPSQSSPGGGPSSGNSSSTTSPPFGNSSTTSGVLATTWTEPDGQTVVSSGSVIVIGSDTFTVPSVSVPFTLTTDGQTFTFHPTGVPGGASSSVTALPSTFTESDGQVVVSSGSILIIGGTDTIPIPSVSQPTTITTDGEVFTFNPPSSGMATGGSSGNPGGTTITAPDGQTIVSSSGVVIIGTDTVTLPTVSSRSTFVTDGETFTLEPPSSASSRPTGAVTTTAPDGQTIISSSGIVIIGSETFTLPTVSSESTFTIGGETFTLEPPSSTSLPPSGPLTTTGADGQTIISSSGVVIIGSDTVTLPIVLSESTFVTDGETFTLEPASTTAPSGPLTTTAPDGQTIISSSGVVIIGSDTITLPSVSQLTTLVTDGETFTLVPQSQQTSQQTTPQGPATSTLPGGQTIVSSSGVIVIGSDTITVPTGLSSPTVVTTDGVTLTFIPSGSRATSSPSTTAAPVTTFSAWPAASISPVPTSVTSAGAANGTSFVPCDLWFFDLCTTIGTLSILGWAWLITPGVLPIGPPPPGVLELPLGWALLGVLPAWPAITIGPDLVPIIPPEPAEGECATQTASICSQDTCATITGCAVTDSSTSTCSTATVTDFVESCTSASGSLSCTTISSTTVTGCSVTATTSTTSCTATATTGPGALRGRQDDGGSCALPDSVYAVYPADGSNAAQTAAIQAALLELTGGDASKIFTSTSKVLGVNFWKLSLTTAQGESLLKNTPNIASVSRSCDDTCYDPSTSFRYQPNAPDHLVFVSQEQGLTFDSYDHRYQFDSSVGDGIPVYVVDTGANLNNLEFTQVDNIASQVSWILVGNENGDQAQDDSGLRGHGTCMLSLVCGANVGVAKRVKPWVVRVPRRAANGALGGATAEDYIAGVAAVLDSVAGLAGTSAQTKAILSMSWTFPRDGLLGPNGEDQSDGFRIRLWQLLSVLVSKGVLPITGSGNGGGSITGGPPIDRWPAAYGYDPSKTTDSTTINEILVVGGVTVPSGDFWKRTIVNNRGIPHMYAPASPIRCASEKAGEHLKDSSGTSDAAAITAGLAAYFLKMGQLGRLPGWTDMSVLGLKNFIISQAWSRPSGNAAASWNALTQQQIQQGPGQICPYVAGAPVRRQDDSTATCIKFSSSASLPSTETSLATSTTDTLQPSTSSPTTTSSVDSTSSLSLPTTSSTTTPSSASLTSTSQPTITTTGTITSTADCQGTQQILHGIATISVDASTPTPLSVVIKAPFADISSSQWSADIGTDAQGSVASWSVDAGDANLASGSGDGNKVLQLLWDGSSGGSVGGGTQISLELSAVGVSFQMTFFGIVPCSPQPSTTSTPTTSCPEPVPTVPQIDPSIPQDMTCTESNLAGRSDCSRLPGLIPAGTNGGLDGSHCVSGSQGTNASGQPYCRWATSNSCSLVVVWGSTDLRDNSPQSRADVVNLVGVSNGYCFRVCSGGNEGPWEGSSTPNQDGNVRVCIMDTDQAANC